MKWWKPLLLSLLLPSYVLAAPLTPASPGVTFESNNLASEGVGTYGVPVISTTQKFAGTYSLRISTGPGGNGLHGIGAGTTGAYALFNKPTIYTSFRFYIATLPTATQGHTAIALGEEISSGNVKWELHVDSNGKLSFYDNSLTRSGSVGATTLSTGTWYEVQVKTGTGAAAAWEVKIGSTVEISGTANQLTGNHDTVYLGFYSNLSNGTPDFYYDNVVIDDASYPDQSGGGGGAVTAKKQLLLGAG